jgi:multidrug efflux pump subunit AcrB
MKNFRPGRFNLSAWSLRHPSMVVYLMVMLLLAGLLAYQKLGRSEDPDFTFKVMVVRTLWPGASAREVELQVTERLEKTLQETPWIDVVRSVSRSGESLIFVTLKDSMPKKDLPDAWYQVRKKVGDIRYTLPSSIEGPFIDDEFGDTFSNIYALTGDGFDLGDLRRRADVIARELYRVPDVKKVELFGVQAEKIYVEVSQARLATLGISLPQISDALAQQNAMLPAGFFETASDRVRLRVSGDFLSPDALREVAIVANGHVVRLGDIAEIHRGLVEPATPAMYFDGRPAVGVGVVMAKGGDVLELGKHLRVVIDRLQEAQPVGVDIHSVADQPQVVEDAIHLFVKSLAEAVIIVLAVSFLSLGLRTGTVVALSIPLVLFITFLLMYAFGIDLQRVSLGALIIALGLLVDDAIITVEMMVVKMEQGWDRFRAATYAYATTAFPMLTGTLVTAASFLPVGFARSSAGEYTFSIFAVVTIALLVSWGVAVVFTPYLGFLMLDPAKLVARAQKHGEDIYDTPFYRRVRSVVQWCVRRHWLVIGATVVVFAVSVGAFNTFVERQFFPASARSELLIDLWLPQGSSLKATTARAHEIDHLLSGDADIDHFVTYVGNGSPRFYLPLDEQLFDDNFAQVVVTSRDLAARERLKTHLEAAFAAPDGAWSGVQVRVQRLENGPPVGYPVQFRVSGNDIGEVRRLAEAVAAEVRANPLTQNVHLNWNELAKVVRLEIDQDKARALGISSQELAAQLNTLLNGTVMTRYREGDQLIDVVARAPGDERVQLSRLPDLNLRLANGRSVPLAQLAHFRYELEDDVIWRRQRQPTITVRADLRGNVQAPSVSQQIDPLLDKLRATLPVGYHIEEGGAIEESGKGEASIKAVVPTALIVVLTLLMMQLQSLQRTVMVVLTAPLGLIGVALALMLSDAPYGFVANLGVIALFGMIMRNSVILVDQIRQDEKAGHTPWEAVVGSAVRRFRPIMLTAAAAILAMIPLSRSVFWGPMAIAIMGGLLVATLLTLLFLPALYAAWFRVRPDTHGL